MDYDNRECWRGWGIMSSFHAYYILHRLLRRLCQRHPEHHRSELFSYLRNDNDGVEEGPLPGGPPIFNQKWLKLVLRVFVTDNTRDYLFWQAPTKTHMIQKRIMVVDLSVLGRANVANSILERYWMGKDIMSRQGDALLKPTMFVSCKRDYGPKQDRFLMILRSQGYCAGNLGLCALEALLLLHCCSPAKKWNNAANRAGVVVKKPRPDVELFLKGSERIIPLGTFFLSKAQMVSAAQNAAQQVMLCLQENRLRRRQPSGSSSDNGTGQQDGSATHPLPLSVRRGQHQLTTANGLPRDLHTCMSFQMNPTNAQRDKIEALMSDLLGRVASGEEEEGEESRMGPSPRSAIHAVRNVLSPTSQSPQWTRQNLSKLGEIMSLGLTEPVVDILIAKREAYVASVVEVEDLFAGRRTVSTVESSLMNQFVEYNTLRAPIYECVDYETYAAKNFARVSVASGLQARDSRYGAGGGVGRKQRKRLRSKRVPESEIPIEHPPPRPPQVEQQQQQRQARRLPIPKGEMGVEDDDGNDDCDGGGARRRVAIGRPTMASLPNTRTNVSTQNQNRHPNRKRRFVGSDDDDDSDVHHHHHVLGGNGNGSNAYNRAVDNVSVLGTATRPPQRSSTGGGSARVRTRRAWSLEETEFVYRSLIHPGTCQGRTRYKTTQVEMNRIFGVDPDWTPRDNVQIKDKERTLRKQGASPDLSWDDFQALKNPAKVVG